MSTSGLGIKQESSCQESLDFTDFTLLTE